MDQAVALPRHRLPARYPVWLFSAALALGAAALYVVALAAHGTPPGPRGIAIPWPFVALGVFAAELKVVDVHFRREKHSFSLSEFPAVIGLFLLSPSDFMLALLLGTTAALLIHRQAAVKMAFNLSNLAFVSVVGLCVVYAIAPPGGIPTQANWVGAFAATTIGAVISACSIATVISLSGGAPQYEKLPEMVQFGVLVAVANTSLALLALTLTWTDTGLLLLLIVPLGTVFLAYRAYVSEREKHQRLELLYQSSRILQHSPELDSALAALLEHAREMFRSEWAEVLLWPRDEGSDGLLTRAHHLQPTELMVPTPIDAANELHRRIAADRRAWHHVYGSDHEGVRNAMAAPLLGEAGLIGSMLIVNRLTEATTFGEDDLRLLETLANQAAVALENGQLEQSLSELSRLKEELRHQAYHDPLTGLANRTLFAERVDAALAAATSERRPVVLFVDLDNFKDVNDTLGHAVGDRLLTAVAERVRGCIREDDLAARLGGDEFAILLHDDERLGRALSVVTRLLEALAVTFPVNGADLKISGSIGIAASGAGVDRADVLLRDADVAMYTAKQAGKNRFAVFEPTMHAAIVARHAMSTELSRGIAEGAIVVYYQPIIHLATGECYGAEALARWRHPTRGLIGPDDFIPLAEESGAILELGRAVLFEACRAAAGWPASPSGNAPTVSVNLSAAQLSDDRFVEELVDILRATGLATDRLVLEMTETVMFHDTHATIARLQVLRDLGVRVAIDDFGTGYSSLGYLRRFPVDILKIARDFVAPAEAGPDGWAFANAIIALGRTLGLRIVAEGIEHQGQLIQLLDLGCELGQGFLFAQPLPETEIALVLGRAYPVPGRRTGRPDTLPALLSA
jgi:diguanylate cyclase (GGDEF)-like protein